MPPSQASPLAYFAAGAATFSLCSLLYTFITAPTQSPPITLSPLSNHKTPSSTDDSPYPLTSFPPGSRDVSTPYGSIRVYEIGPLQATRKVLLIHGVSTPSPALASVAEHFASKGCRVLLFDLFGRGYSDTPADIPHDARLYTTQILLALASSPVPWTGGDGGGFSVLGYSMGGAIAANFTSYFPTLVSDLVLVAPAGLLRPSHRSWGTSLLYSPLFPTRLAAYVATSRLLTNPNVKTASLKGDTASPASAEVANLTSRPHAFGCAIDPQAIVRWQVDTHAGFGPAFISSIKRAPISAQHSRWHMIGECLDAQRVARGDTDAEAQGLRCGKVLMVLGRTDEVILADEIEEDARAAFGEGNLDVLMLEAGHEVPITHGKEIVEWVWQKWEEVDAV